MDIDEKALNRIFKRIKEIEKEIMTEEVNLAALQQKTPVALVAGCGKACEIAEKEYKENRNKAKVLKSALEDMLNASKVNFHFNGEQKYCIESTANICFCGVMSEEYRKI